MQVLTYAFRPATSYALLDADASPAVLGAFGAIFALPALALALPSGRLVDRWGERRTAIAGGVLLVAASVIALAGLESIAALVLATLLLGCGHLLSVVAEQALVANRSRAGSRDSAFGMYTLVVSIGQVVGPLLIAIPEPGGEGPDLGIAFAASTAVAVGVLVSGALLRGIPSLPVEDPTGMLRTASGLLRRRGVVRALLASSLSLASVDITLTYWPALGNEAGMAPWVISAMLMTRSLCTMLSRAGLGTATRLFGRRRVMVLSLALAALAFASTALPLGPFGLIVLAGVYGLAIGVSQPVTMSWLTDLAPAGQRGMTLSLRLAGNRIGQSAVPAAVGLLAAGTGAGGVLVATAGALLVASWSALALDQEG
ncbi:MFS transporter [Naasia sp. SYSU D00057]|uniref:MFS transporter n=1 Tax=Naasia sp. SYSU D00057 TaxID=2817380 RepID=UPI001B30E7F3|nr:MFS transporter [Naasia sp. SYSU D00057]